MSLSVLKVDDPILKSLDSATQAPAWPVGVGGTVPKPTANLSSSSSWSREMWSWATRSYDKFLHSTKLS